MHVPLTYSSAGGASRAPLWPLVACLWLLVYATFSPPDELNVSRFGTAPILPPAVLSAIKLLSRAIAIALMGFSLAAVWHYRQRQHVIRAMISIILFAVLGIVSTLWSPLKGVSLTQASTFGLLVLMAMYIAAVWSSDQDTERLVAHLGLALATLSLLLLSVHFVMPHVGSLTREATGILHSTNACAAAGLGVTITVAARVLWNSYWSRWWPLLIPIHVAAMFVGGNRLSLVVTCVVVAAVLAVVARWGRLAIACCAVSAVGTAYLALDPRLALIDDAGRSIGLFATQGQSASELGSLSGRSEMWQKMWDSYLESPIIGHGYFVTSQQGRVYVWYEWGNWTAHNLYLQLLTTTGLVGTTLILGGLGYLLFAMLHGASGRRGVRPTAWFVCIVFGWIFGWALLNESFAGPLQPESLVFAVAVGVAGGVVATSKIRAERKWSAVPPAVAEGA